MALSLTLPTANGALAPYALRGTAPYDPDNGTNWYIASNLDRFKLVEEQRAPSITRSGQLLIALSYFSQLGQDPINQSPPEGMTEIIDLANQYSSLSIAVLFDPPNPTLDRRFTPAVIPNFPGHSIAASILVPGEQVF